MNWDDLRVFLSLARNGRVNSAAKSLQIDPTTLIRRVKKLESVLNCSLFELRTNGYYLTENGKLLVRYLEKAEHFIHEAKNELTGERTDLSGTIRVSVSEGFGTWFLAPRLRDFKRAYPNISVELVATSGFLNLHKREADIAILLEKQTKGNLKTIRLTDYNLCLYMHKSLLQEEEEPAQIDALSHYNLVSYVPDLIYAPQLNFFETSMISPLQTLRSTSINAQYQMIKSGAGVGILPHFIATQDDSLIPIIRDKIAIKRTFWLSTHKDVSHLARIKAFVSWITEQVGDHKDEFIGD